MAEVRDNRRQGWYWVDNAILETYGAKLGPYGIAVYNVLAFRANNNTQRCWPGHADIARLTGASVAQVKRALRTLKDLRLIDIETRRRGDGWDTNLYTLLEVPGGSASQTSALPDPTRSVLPEPRVGSGSTTNKTHEQDSSITTHIQVCADERDNQLPDDLRADLEAIGFHSRAGVRLLASLCAEDADRARALVEFAKRQGKRPAAFLSSALSEGWDPPPAPVVLGPPDPDCTLCNGVGRLMGEDGVWGEPCNCTLAARRAS